MGAFYFGMTHKDIAQQIAVLLNRHNELAQKRTGEDILNSNTNYVVETHGRYVIGAAGICKVSHQMSELKHIVVSPSWRRKGLSRFLIQRALDICSTPLVYSTVKSDNAASLKALEGKGFSRVDEYESGSFPFSFHKVALLTRVTPKWTTPRQNPKSVSSPETRSEMTTVLSGESHVVLAETSIPGYDT